MSPQTCENKAHQYVLAYDVGTTGIKTCLFDLAGGVRLIADAVGDYSLYLLDNGGAEQVPNEWWDAMCSTTKGVLTDSAFLTMLYDFRDGKEGWFRGFTKCLA